MNFTSIDTPTKSEMASSTGISDAVQPFSIDEEFDYDNAPLTVQVQTEDGIVEVKTCTTWNTLDDKRALQAKKKECVASLRKGAADAEFS